MSKLFAWIGLVVLLVALAVVLTPDEPPALPLIQASAPMCVPPASHYFFKQRRIA